MHIYNQRVIKVEKATFTPLVFTTTGGMGEECAAFLKLTYIAEKISMKTGQRYCEVKLLPSSEEGYDLTFLKPV